MLLTSARVVPHIARACFASLVGAIVTMPSAIVAVTSLLTTRRKVPSAPLALSVWPESSTSTPFGTATGFLPIRDIEQASKDATENFAADLRGAGLVIGHN